MSPIRGNYLEKEQLRMKSLHIQLLIAFFILLGVIFQGNAAPTEAATVNDEKKIETVIIGYITNFFLNDYEKMEGNLHEKLSKRGVNPNGKLSKNYSKADLKRLMENKPAMPLTMQKNTVSGIRIGNRVAVAVLDTGYPKTRWKEFVHLAKLDGKWIILDVFWSYEKIRD